MHFAQFAHLVPPTEKILEVVSALEYAGTSNLCDPLGDFNVWGTLFDLRDSNSDDIILLATKVHVYRLS